jgi:hypothetical protein
MKSECEAETAANADQVLKSSHEVSTRILVVRHATRHYN